MGVVPLQRRLLLAVIATAAVAICVVLYLMSSHGPRTGSPISEAWAYTRKPLASSSSWLSKSRLQADLKSVYNSTLGFQKVFAISLPDRSDKRDAISLTARLTGFDVEWIDGVRGESIPDKAVPLGIDRPPFPENALGCWRGHMNAIRRIVEDNLESALIMEDDADWDIYLKPLLEQVSAGTRDLLSNLPATFSPPHMTGAGTATSAYGDNWDVLWLGHCGDWFPEDLPDNKDLPADDPVRIAMARKNVITGDPAVAPPDKLTGFQDFMAYPPRTRWVHTSGAPICMFAYALSQRGARKILFDLSIDRLTGAVDNALAELCARAVSSWPDLVRRGPADRAAAAQDYGLYMKCMSVTPPLFFHHRGKGRIAADSDINAWGVVEEGAPPAIRLKGSTENIAWSARLNIRNLLMGLPLENQFELNISGTNPLL